jgi:hypothetical protein
MSQIEYVNHYSGLCALANKLGTLRLKAALYATGVGLVLAIVVAHWLGVAAFYLTVILTMYMADPILKRIPDYEPTRLEYWDEIQRLVDALFAAASPVTAISDAPAEVRVHFEDTTVWLYFKKGGDYGKVKYPGGYEYRLESVQSVIDLIQIDSR